VYMVRGKQASRRRDGVVDRGGACGRRGGEDSTRGKYNFLVIHLL